MAFEEKRAWIRLVVAVLGYTAYATVILTGRDGRALAETPYAEALLWTVGLAVVAAVLTEALVAGRSRATDERDREIGRLGEQVGQSFVVIGAVAAMLMAMAGWDRFWIANVVHLCFVLSAVLGGVAKVVLYRRGVPQW